jgi:hypothetical protein
MSTEPFASKRSDVRGLCMETAAAANAGFLGNLERWIDSTIECDLEVNRSPEQLVEKVKESIMRAMQSNIEYHNILAKVYEADEDGKSPTYLRHKLMIQIYESLLCSEQGK